MKYKVTHSYLLVESTMEKLDNAFDEDNVSYHYSQPFKRNYFLVTSDAKTVTKFLLTNTNFEFEEIT